MKSSIVTKSMIMGTLCSLVGLAAAPADAAIRRVHSSACHYYYDDAGTSIYNGPYLSISGSTRGIYCPAPSDSEVAHGSASYLMVDGYQSGGIANYTRACVKSYSGTSTSCGNTAAWGTNGTSVPDLSSWTSNSTWYSYLYHNMKSGSRLHGFFYY